MNAPLIVAAALAWEAATGWPADRLDRHRCAAGDLAGARGGRIDAVTLTAARSLYRNVAALQTAFVSGGLNAARTAAGHIVGRRTAALDRQAVCRTAIESLAENASGGVTAALFWGAVFGLPGLFAYKALNTLNSMIGYRSDHYEAYGKVAARLEDLANWVPARLTALLVCALSSG